MKSNFFLQKNILLGLGLFLVLFIVFLLWQTIHLSDPEQNITNVQTVTAQHTAESADTPTLYDTTLPTTLRWNQLFLEAIAGHQINPPQATHMLASVHIAQHDALQFLAAGTTSVLASDSWDTPNIPDTTAVLDHIGKLVFSSHFPGVDTVALTGIVATTSPSALFAEQVFQTLTEHPAITQQPPAPTESNRATDELGHWRTTPPYFAAPLLPHWGDRQTFVISSDDMTITPPPTVDTEQYADEYNEVYTYGSITSKKRTKDQTEIAQFWEDGKGSYTPPGHWNSIAQQIALDAGLSEAEQARLFAELNIALSDTAIAVWDQKYTHNYWRPIDAIRLADQDENEGTNADAEWFNFIETPNFPEYPSGHSAFSAAGAAVLADWFGDDTIFTTQSRGLPGISRTYHSFTTAAEEAGMSRIYGGIHFQSANAAGAELGTRVAKRVLDEF